MLIFKLSLIYTRHETVGVGVTWMYQLKLVAYLESSYHLSNKSWSAWLFSNLVGSLSLKISIQFHSSPIYVSNINIKRAINWNKIFIKIQLWSLSPACLMQSESKGLRKKWERENNCVNSGNYVCHAASLQRRTGSARTLLGPINDIYWYGCIKNYQDQNN